MVALNRENWIWHFFSCSLSYLIISSITWSTAEVDENVISFIDMWSCIKVLAVRLFQWLSIDYRTNHVIQKLCVTKIYLPLLLQKYSEDVSLQVEVCLSAVEIVSSSVCCTAQLAMINARQHWGKWGYKQSE